MSPEPTPGMPGRDESRMTGENSLKQKATELRARNEQLEVEHYRLELVRREMRKDVRRLKWRLRRIDARLWVRRFADRIAPWRMGTFLVLTTVFAATWALLFPKMVVFILGALLGAVLFGLLLVFPNDDVVAERRRERADALSRASAEYASLADKADRHAGKVEKVGRRYEETAEELRRKQLLESTGARRTKLAERNWRALRGEQFESFLRTALEELGYEIEAPKRGEGDVDFIAARPGRRVCVQLQTEDGAASERAVQNVHYARAANGCDACALVTNRQATLAARELALAVGCLIVDEDSLKELILGEIAL